jgi:hypothetical protein
LHILCPRFSHRSIDAEVCPTDSSALESLEMFSPLHGHPQFIETERLLFEDAGFVDVSVGGGFNEIKARGKRSAQIV